MKPGWEDLVRRCIQRFHLQNDGEMSFAKRHQQEGNVTHCKGHPVYVLASDSYFLWCLDVVVHQLLVY